MAIACSAAASADAQDFRERPYLLGDGLGPRKTLADHGITFENDITQFHFGVTSGGLDEQFTYAGHGDYVTNVDFGKMGVQEGLFLKLRAEHRFGESIAGNTGAFSPATIQSQLPTTVTEHVYLTDVLFTQFLSDTFGVFAGKIETFDGDANAFASGRGKTQFSNLAFVVNPTLLRTMPYSSLGSGLFGDARRSANLASQRHELDRYHAHERFRRIVRRRGVARFTAAAAD